MTPQTLHRARFYMIYERLTYGKATRDDHRATYKPTVLVDLSLRISRGFLEDVSPKSAMRAFVVRAETPPFGPVGLPLIVFQCTVVDIWALP